MLDAAELTKRLNAQLDAAYNEYDAAKAKGDEAGMKMALARQEILIPAISLLALGAYDRAVALLAAKGVEFERKAAAVRASPLPAPATDPFEPPEKVEFSDAQLDAAAAKQPSAEPAKVAAGKPAGWSEDYQ